MAAWADEGLPLMHMLVRRMGGRTQKLDKESPQLKRKV